MLTLLHTNAITTGNFSNGIKEENQIFEFEMVVKTHS